jgi:hypothetical protein
VKKLPKSVRKELKALASLPDSFMDFSDILESKREDWVGAVRGKFFKPRQVRKSRRG